MNLKSLSPTQREIFPLLAEGWQNGAIADRLGMSKASVAKHVERIMRRVGAGTRLEVATMAARIIVRAELEKEAGRVTHGIATR